MSSVQFLKPTQHAVIEGAFERTTLVPQYFTSNPETKKLVFDDLDFAKPFVVINDAFLDVIGKNPKMTLIASNDVLHGGDGKPFAHEAGVYFEQTGDVYFTSNLLEDASNDISKINPTEALKKVTEATPETLNETLRSTWTVINPEPQVLTGNGATRFKDTLLICSQGKGNVASGLVEIDVISSEKKPASRPILNNFFGRRFNSVNDVVVLPGPTKDVPNPTTDRVDLHADNPRTTIWFTDPIYGYAQGYNPHPTIVPQVYAFNPTTGDVRVVADGFVQPNGIAFNYEGTRAYVTDSGHITGNGEYVWNRASTIYEFDVVRPTYEDDPFEVPPKLTNRRLFAYIDAGIPDGIKTDRKGNVYSGCGDGIHVWNKHGLLIGKVIFFPDSRPETITPEEATASVTNKLGTRLRSRWCANFNFIPDGKILAMAEDRIYLIEFDAPVEGALLI